MKLFQRSQTAIGIDIGSRTIKAAQLSVTDNGPALVALAMVPRHAIGTTIEREDILHLRHVLRRQGFVGRNLVLAVPEEQLLRGHLDLPPGVDGAPAAQMARMELARIHQVDSQSFEMMHWGLPGAGNDSGQGQTSGQTVAVACPHQAADTLLDTVEACGLEVQALDVRTAAAARACQSLTPAPPALTAILDLGWSSAKLMLVSGATVVYERLLKSKLSALTETLTQRFHLEDQAAYRIIDTVGLCQESDLGDLDPVSLEAIQRFLTGHFGHLAEELHVPFTYAAHHYTQTGIQRLLLIGGGAGIPGLAAHLAELLNLEVRRAAPKDLMIGTAASLGNADNPALTVAMGLALFSEASA
jgi:type IV pilus assembly protein PilM